MKPTILLILTLILTACTAVTPSPAPTATPPPTPTATATPTPTPTPVPTPTPTPIPTLPPGQVGGLEGVPDPRAAAPELFDLTRPDAPIPQFVNAMKMAGIEVNPEEVANNLQYQTITGADGKPYVIGVYPLDPNPATQGETLEGPIPLVIGEMNEKGEWRWSKTWMKDIAKLLPIEIGNSLVYKKSDFSVVSSRRYHETLAQNSSVLILSQGFYWKWFERSMDAPIDSYSRSDILSQIQIIKEMKKLNPNLKIRISPFGSFPQNDPEWLNGLSRNEAEIQLREHMQQVYDLLTRNGIAGDEYVVINEPFFKALDGRGKINYIVFLVIMIILYMHLELLEKLLDLTPSLYIMTLLTTLNINILTITTLH